jgi:AmmeMemoRadiSam system protein B
VHLPFLQVAVPGVPVLPLVVGAVPADDVAGVLDHTWGGSETLVVVSTDLSHDHDYATAAALDRETAAAIVAGRPEALRPEQACGAYPLRGLLTAARHRGLGVELLDLRSSGDTAGPRHRVVGYGAFALA